MSYKQKHFALEELVDPHLYKHVGERCWELLDDNALMALDALRERFGPLVVNNWHSKGSSFTHQIYRESGLRRWDTGTGAKRSQHKFGRAFDCKFANYEPYEVANYVVANPDEFPLITRVEDVTHTPTWFHFDTKPTNQPGIYVFKP